MAGNTYSPEGTIIGTGENKAYLSSVSSMEMAMTRGKILEGVAAVCEAGMNLKVNLGDYYGVMPRDEVAYSQSGAEIKDIAVITRVGRAVSFKIIGFGRDEEGNTIPILSRKAAQKECAENYLMSLIPGDIIYAKVTHMEQFGAFVDIGCGIVSLLSIDCISISRISHPKDRLTVGMKIPVVVKSIDYDTGRIYVTHRELLGTWEQNADKFTVGETVTGIVRSIESYGIFVEIAPNLAGLAEPREGIEIGDVTAAYIKSIIPEKMKIKLVLVGMSQEKYSRGKPEYFIDADRVKHIDYWRYSPITADKTVESRFN